MNDHGRVHPNQGMRAAMDTQRGIAMDASESVKELIAERDMLNRVVESWAAQFREATAKLESSEAAITRVRALAAEMNWEVEWPWENTTPGSMADRINAAIDGR
jgi:hypothetical protein